MNKYREKELKIFKLLSHKLSDSKGLLISPKKED